MALSSRLAVSGQISGIIRPDIRYYLAGYPVLYGRISGRISESGSKKLQDIRLSGFGSISRISGYPAKSLSGTSLFYMGVNKGFIY